MKVFRNGDSFRHFIGLLDDLAFLPLFYCGKRNAVLLESIQIYLDVQIMETALAMAINTNKPVMLNVIESNDMSNSTKERFQNKCSIRIYGA